MTGPRVDTPDDNDRIRANVAKMRAQSATDAEVEHYLANVEGIKPVGRAPLPTRAPSGRAPLPPRIAAEASGVRPDYLGDKAQAALPDRRQFGTGFLRSAEQGATFGFGDEINAGARAAFSPETYAAALGDERGQMKAYKQANPGTSLFGELAGAVGGGAAGGAVLGAAGKVLGVGGKAIQAVRPMTAGRRVLGVAKEAAVGAGLGGVAAAGTAEGDLSDRAAAVPAGMAWGAGVPLGLKAGAALGNATKITPLVKSLLPRPASTATGAGKAFSALGVNTHAEIAKDDALKLIARARMSIDDVEAQAKMAHPDAMLMNIVGDPMVSRAGGAYTTPSRGATDMRAALESQGQRAPKATREAASTGLGVTRENTVKTVEQLAADRSRQGDETFGALRQHYGTPQKIDALDGLVGRPSFDKAIGETENILRESPSGLSQPLLMKVKVGGKTQTVVRPLTFDEATLLKQSHDDVAGMGTALSTIETGGVTKTRAGKQKNTHGELMDALKASFAGDEATGVPSYEKALSQSAEPMKLIKAHDLGQNFMKAKTDELEAMWPSLSEPEKEFYRKGAIASVEDAVRGKTEGFNPVKDFRDDIMRDNLKLIMPTEQAYSDFYGAVKALQGMHRDRGHVLGNSLTASRTAQREEAAGPSAGDIVSAATSPSGAIGFLAKSALGKRASGLTEAQVDALAPLFTASGPDLDKVIAELRAHAAKQAGRRPLPSRAAGQIAGASTASNP